MGGRPTPEAASGSTKFSNTFRNIPPDFRVLPISRHETHELEDIMNWDQIEGKWKQYKGKAKAKWGELTDDELDRIEGRREELVGLVQERYGQAREAAEKEVDDWLRDA
jgi:uncharacterized protein YjbJ (UPF0337 family)